MSVDEKFPKDEGTKDVEVIDADDTDTTPQRAELEAFMKTNPSLLYSFACRLTRNTDKAADLVQDTYVRALAHLHQYTLGTNIKDWLIRILHNIFVNQYRREKQYGAFLNNGVYIDGTTLFGDLQSNRSGVAFQPVSRAVEEAFEDLSTEHRDVLALAAKDTPYNRIAETLQIPKGTVMSRLHRGRQELRAKLASLDLELVLGQEPNS